MLLMFKMSGYLNDKAAVDFLSELEQISRMIHAFRKSLS
jgi:hypothetical protein